MPKLPESGVFQPSTSTGFRYSIGAVSLFQDGKDTGLMGEPRVAALTRLYRGEDIAPLQPFVYGHGPITRDEINWETSAIPGSVK